MLMSQFYVRRRRRHNANTKDRTTRIAVKQMSLQAILTVD